MSIFGLSSPRYFRDTYGRPMKRSRGFETDAQELGRDWQAVGGYLQNAMDKVRLEEVHNGQKAQ